MNLIDYLDRIGERRARRPYRPFDTRLFIGFGFLAGYYSMVWHLMRVVIPNNNVPLVRDAMLVLGPAVGLIVGALFRSDVRDEQATANTGEAFKAFGATARAAEAAATQLPTPATGKPDDPVHTVEETK